MDHKGTHLWSPVSNGVYDIDQIAVSSCGVLCLTEKRLCVAALFFDASTQEELGIVEEVASVRVANLVFSDDGRFLYVLALNPTTVVSVLHSNSGKDKFRSITSVDFSRVGTPISLLCGRLTGSADGFVLCYDDEFSGFTPDALNGYQECFRVQEPVVCATIASDQSLVYMRKDGKLFSYVYTEATSFQVCTFENGAPPTSVVVYGGFAIVSFADGCLFQVLLENGEITRLPCEGLTSPVSLLSKGTGDTFIFSCNDALYHVSLPHLDGGVLRPTPIRSRTASPTLKCFSLSEMNYLWVVTSGSFYVRTTRGVTEFPSGAESAGALDACLLDSRHVLILYDDHTLRCYDFIDGAQQWCESVKEWRPSRCEANTSGKVICFNEGTLCFFNCTPSSAESCGVGHAEMLASILLVRWLPNEDSFLAVCTNGDAFLASFPTENDLGVFHVAEALTMNSWRLDFPVVDLLPCYSTPEVVNLFAHSLDKDSKVYALDRKADAERKISRPFFLMNDHESGGSCLCMNGASSIVSCGRDGSIVIRDVSSYQTRMTPIPPSREKRPPLLVSQVRAFVDGGITTASVMHGGMGILCGGKDAVLNCAMLSATPIKELWQEPLWRRRLLQTPGQASVVELTADLSAMHGFTDQATLELEQAKKKIRTELDHLRKMWSEAMLEKDTEVPVENLLTTKQKVAFDAQCEKAVHGMREYHYYNAILNQYLQDLLKQRCWDSMDVIRTKVVSMSQVGLEVHNFHIHKHIRDQSNLSKKALFLRQLQKKTGAGRLVSAAFPKQRRQSVNAAGVAEPTDDYLSVSYDKLDLYTRPRMTLQILLLKGYILDIKDEFNTRFKDLQELKKQSIAQVEERTLRCIVIGKQLGELPGPLYKSVEDPDENPASIFRVNDSELSEEVRKLIPPANTTTIVSAVDEAALPLWMDGLEKEVLRVEVNVPLPEFADDTRESFVPTEERTEEQIRVMEEYEKKLKEETEKVELRRDALRNEFSGLQKKNEETATTLDKELLTLRDYRLSTAERVDEGELQLALLLRHELITSAAHQLYHRHSQQRNSLLRQLSQLQLALGHRSTTADLLEVQVQDLQNELHFYADNCSTEAPFTDSIVGEKLHRRFGRWLKRFEDGKASLPDVEKPAPDASPEQWAAFCRHCRAVDALRTEMLEAEAEAEGAMELMHESQQACAAIQEEVRVEENAMEVLKVNSVSNTLDGCNLYYLHQGQIQDERVALCSDFADSRLRWCTDVTRYNDLIVASDAEKGTLTEKVFERQKLMKFLQWERTRLQYCIGTLEMELRQLHTLRVTRQMQEWLAGDADVSEEKVLRSIGHHMEVVNANMKRKADDIKVAMHRVRGQIAEVTTENTIIDSQCRTLGSAVQDHVAVYRLIDSHADSSSKATRRAQDIFETSELEELARAQQEELVRLKGQVDRMRERTFPSFAVVSKRTH